MPKKEIDYSKTVIYKIVCNDLTIKDLYVGSTTDFRNRKNHHKTACNNPQSKDYNMKVYEFIRNNGNWENWTMVEIEKYPCNDGNEARSRERHFIEKLKATLNKNIPTRTLAEYNKEKKEFINSQKKQYYKKNKSKFIEKHKSYRNKNKEIISKPYKCECGGRYTHEHKSTHYKSLRHQKYEKQKEQ